MTAVICILLMLFTGCSRSDYAANNSTGTSTGTTVDTIGPRNTNKNTVAATLTNAVNPNGVTVNWSLRVSDSEITLSGLQTITFIIDGDEVISSWGKDTPLSSIKLEFTGNTSGKKEELSTSLTGKVTNLTADGKFFKIDGYNFSFYPHYFNVGEKVTVKATFIYKEDNLSSSKEAAGFFTFTVGEDTGEQFTGIMDGAKDWWNNITNPDSSNTDTTDSNGNTTNTSSEDKYLSVRYSVDGVEGEVARYESEATPIKLKSKELNISFYSVELGITKMYLRFKANPDSPIAWNNPYYADNVHKFTVDLSEYSGQTVVFRVQSLKGSEWNPVKTNYYGFIVVEVP